MDFGTQPHASFIPKAPLAAPTPKAYRTSRVSVVMLLSLLIFIASIAAAAGVFLYERYLSQSLDSKKASLEKAREAFDPVLIQELSRLDRRIEFSKGLLKNHVALTSLFDLLQSATLQNVQFTALNFTTDPDGTKKAALKGEAKDYASVALQSDEFGKAKGIKNPVFSDLVLTAVGTISFSVQAGLDTDLLNYANVSSQSQDQGATAGFLNSLDTLDASSSSFSPTPSGR